MTTPRGAAADHRRRGSVNRVRAAGSADAGCRGPALVEGQKIAMGRTAVVAAEQADRICSRPRRRHGAKRDRGGKKCCKSGNMRAHSIYLLTVAPRLSSSARKTAASPREL